MAELTTYRRKRDPARTPEPVPKSGSRTRDGGKADTEGRRFVVQEHHARALHWDFRLERDGVLVSWAVPKGIPPDPGTNHLAVHTEDHPLEYATFEGEIPKGEYGGGTVTIWDSGTYDVEKWTDREVKVVLDGARVRGRYVLFRTRGKDWMMHRMDPPEPGFEKPPPGLKPMLAVARDTMPDAEGWAYEFKWDGVRALVFVEGGRPRVVSRNGRDVTVSYPEMRELAASLGSCQIVLDGEIVALDADGRPSFSLLQRRMHVGDADQARRLAASTPATFFAFDMLHIDGRSTTSLPYAKRRELLEALDLNGPSWHTPPYFTGDGAAVLAASQEQRLEGVMCKRLDSVYAPGKRCDWWLKVKNLRTQEVVIGGWKPGAGRREGTVGSLLLGVPDADGALRFVGHVGTGFSERMLADLHARLSSLERKTSPFADEVPREFARFARWTTPRLVGEVAFGEWTPDGRLRHPRWRGLRPDKGPADVVREP